MCCILCIVLCAGYPTTDSCTKLSDSSVDTYIQQCLIYFLSVFPCFFTGHRNLIAFSEEGSDPYVRMYLLPDKRRSGRRKTHVSKKTLNPVFDQMYVLHYV